MNPTVKFTYNDKEDIYCCYIENLKTTSVLNERDFNSSYHLANHKNDNVENLLIQNSDIQALPNIGHILGNIKVLNAYNTTLRRMTNENLRQFPKLEVLRLKIRGINYLPGDLFQFNRKLKEIYINCDPALKYIGPELFDGLKLLSLQIEVEGFNRGKYEFYFTNPTNGLSRPINLIKENLKRHFPLTQKFLLMNNMAPPKIQLDPKETFMDAIVNFSKLDEFKDFTIKINGRELKVHKFIFTARSETFAELMRNNPDMTELVLTDISIETFETIIKFMYTDEMPKDPKNFKELFAAASKLKIKSLNEILVQYLESNMKTDLDSLMENLNLGLKFEAENLKLKAFEEIKKHFPGTTLKQELAEQPERLKKLIEVKKIEKSLLEG